MKTKFYLFYLSQSQTALPALFPISSENLIERLKKALVRSLSRFSIAGLNGRLDCFSKGNFLNRLLLLLFHSIAEP